MKKLIYIFILTSIFISSCRKKTTVTGVVYSKHNIPVPNVAVESRYYKESNYPEGHASATTTNERGEFKLEFNARNLKHDIKCFCDSGYQISYINEGTTNNIDLHLE
jgi:hypothetical protein